MRRVVEKKASVFDFVLFYLIKKQVFIKKRSLSVLACGKVQNEVITQKKIKQQKNEEKRKKRKIY